MDSVIARIQGKVFSITLTEQLNSHCKALQTNGQGSLLRLGSLDSNLWTNECLKCILLRIPF